MDEDTSGDLVSCSSAAASFFLWTRQTELEPLKVRNRVYLHDFEKILSLLVTFVSFARTASRSFFFGGESEGISTISGSIFRATVEEMIGGGGVGGLSFWTDDNFLKSVSSFPNNLKEQILLSKLYV